MKVSEGNNTNKLGGANNEGHKNKKIKVFKNFEGNFNTKIVGENIEGKKWLLEAY